MILANCRMHLREQLPCGNSIYNEERICCSDAELAQTKGLGIKSGCGTDTAIGRASQSIAFIDAHQPAQSMKQKPIYAISGSESETNQILNSLLGSGPSACDIRVLPSNRNNSYQPRFADEGKLSQTVVVGGLIGACVGAAIGIVAGFEAFSIPGVLQLLVAGAVIGVLTALLAGGAAENFFKQLIGTADSASKDQRQPSRIPEGNFLMSIRPVSRKERLRVEKILNEEGVEEISWS